MKRAKDKKIKALCLLACAAVLGAMLAFPAIGDNASYPTLYVNDQPYYAAAFPLELVEGSEYIPIWMIKALVGGDTFISREKSDDTNFVLSYGYGSRYLSCLLNSKQAYFGNSETGAYSDALFLDSRNLNSTIYVPARQVCDLLGVKYEASSHPLAFRIYDSSGKVSLSKQLEKYFPTTTEEPPTQTQPTVEPTTTASPTEPPTAPPPTRPDETQPTTLPEDTTPRAASLAFIGPPDEASEDMLALLKQRGIRAVFYLTRSDIEQSPAAVRRYLIDGHEIGVYVPKMADPELYYDYVESVNTMLAAACKFTALRLMAQDEPCRAQLWEIKSLRGYAIEVPNIKINQAVTAKTAADAAFTLFKSRTITKITLTQTRQQYEALKEFLSQINAKQYYTIRS